MPRKDFHRVILHNGTEDMGLPVLMLGNHTSWWDGFIAQYINLELFRRKLHIMMLEEELEKRLFLNKTGAYSIRKGHRSALESLRYTAEILKDPENLVILFPQGQIRSVMEVPVTFEKGWFRIFSSMDGPVQIVFFVSLFDYFSHRKPELHIYLTDYRMELTGPEDLNRAFNAFLEESIDHQKSRA